VEWYRGEEVYNYAGGQARDHYASSFWMKLAEEIRQRDKVCQWCGKPPRPGTKLHVHHIHPWRYSQNDDHSNLQALCPSCHKKADHELGL
jgi:5-methylcytosine-specific restriction endonuclease McrA